MAVTGKKGANLGRDSKKAAPSGVMSTFERLRAHHPPVLLVLGVHLCVEAVRAVKVHLQAGAQDFSQLYLDADMEGNHAHV